MAINPQAQPFPPLPDLCAEPEPTPEPEPEPESEPTVTLTAQELASETGADLDRAERILAVASAIVVEYAPAAPVALLNESAIRLGGYLAQSDYGTVRDETIGPRSVSYQMNHAMMFRNSGAMALLTRWKKRRAGTI